MSSFINLPRSLKLKDTIIGRGIFTEGPITRAKTIFTSRPFLFGVGGVTVEHVRAVCHHCMVRVRGTAAIVCPECKVVGYCSDACRDSAMPLHAMECKGLVQLENLRGHSTAAYTVTTDDKTLYWPPPIAVAVARALNKQLLRGSDQDGNWLEYLTWNDSHAKMKTYPLMYPYMRMLVPDEVSDHDIYRAFCTVSINSADVTVPKGTAATALFMEYSLINHMCRLNCAWKMEGLMFLLHVILKLAPN